jgi:hypothetical protein
MPTIQGDRAVRLGDSDSWRLVNHGANTVYYADAATVSSSSNDGSVASGATAVLVGPKWLICASGNRADVDYQDATTPFERDIAYLDSRIVAPGPIISAGTSGVGVGTASHVRGIRVVCRRSGVLKGLTANVQVQSGNYQLGVAGTDSLRTVLYAGALTAVPAVGAYTTLVDPNITVAAGDQLDFLFSFDNTTARFSGAAMNQAACGQLPSGFPLTPGGLAPQLTFNWAAGTPAGIPAIGSGLTGATGTVSTASTIPWIVAYIL